MRECKLAGLLYAGSGVTAREPLISKWRKMRIRLLPKNEWRATAAVPSRRARQNRQPMTP